MKSSKWKEISLADVCEYISRGVTPAYTDENGVVVLNQKCIRDNKVSFELSRLTDPKKKKIPEDKYLKSFDVLVNSTGTGTLGRVAQIKQVVNRITVDSHITIVRANDKINPRFLGYNLFMQQSNIEALGEGSTGQTELSRARLAEIIKIPIPSFLEQKSIAATLSCLDDMIELNNRTNQVLEEMAQAIFKHWFVDFEFPNEDGEPYKSSGGEMVDNELGKIPKGWRVGKAKEFFNISIGKTPPRKEPQWFTKNKNNIKWVSISDMGNCGLFILDSSEYLTTEAVKKFNVKIVPSNTVLLSFKLTIGRVAITNEAMATNEAIAHFITDDIFVTEYLYFYLKLFNYQDLGNTSSIATAINSKIVKAMSFLMPSDDIMKKYHNIVNALFNQIRINQKECKTLVAIRDTLLPKLMSGEIRIPVEEVG